MNAPRKNQKGEIVLTGEQDRARKDYTRLLRKAFEEELAIAGKLVEKTCTDLQIASNIFKASRT